MVHIEYGSKVYINVISYYTMKIGYIYFIIIMWERI